MRKLALATLFAAPLALATLSPAGAFVPRADPGAGPSDLTRVRLVCDPNRCIDPQTGAYTQSGCNYRGCYPIGGIVGYTTPGSGYGGGGGYRGPYGGGGGYPGYGGGYGPRYPGYGGRRRWSDDDDE
jgi:hypothetical protein